MSSSGGTVHVSTQPPSPPRDAAFAIVIDFQKGSENPTRIFQAADALIRALEGLDRTLCAAVDPHIEPVMMLEDIEAGSLKVWLANQLRSIDDEALKTLDWKQLVGRYLIRGKYAFIRWSNKEGDGRLTTLAQEIRSIAVETDVRQIPDYAPPSIAELTEAAKRVDSAKDSLLPTDRLTFLGPDEAPIEFNLSARWTEEELSALAVRETIRFPDMPMLLIVKKPDYLGVSKWDFRHGKVAISARIDDGDWLKRFQTRQVDVRPGDALRCRVAIERKYGFDSELIAEDHVISKVEAVVENQFVQLGMHDDLASKRNGVDP